MKKQLCSRGGMKKTIVQQGRNEKFQNEQREECIKKGWEPLLWGLLYCCKLNKRLI